MDVEKDDTSKEDKTLEEIENNDTDDELDEILNDDKDKKEKVDDEDDDDKSGDKNKKSKEKIEDGEKKVFNKKVGNHVAHSQEEYDELVTKIYNDNSRLANKVKELGGDPKEVSKKDESKVEEKDKTETTDKKKTPEQIYYEVEEVGFRKKFSIASEYKEEMALKIRKGKADINGEPSFALALAKCLKSDGVAYPAGLISLIRKQSGQEGDGSSSAATKKVMKSGGVANATGESQETFSKDERQEMSDYGDKMGAGLI